MCNLIMRIIEGDQTAGLPGRCSDATKCEIKRQQFNADGQPLGTCECTAKWVDLGQCTNVQECRKTECDKFLGTCTEDVTLPAIGGDDEKAPPTKKCGGTWEIYDIEIKKVSGPILKLIVEYLKYHNGVIPNEIRKPLPANMMDKKVPNEDRKLLGGTGIDQRDADFINNKTKKVIFQFILAANYMDIKSALHLGCAKIACMIKGKSPQEIKDILGDAEAGAPGTPRGRANARNGIESMAARASRGDNDGDDEKVPGSTRGGIEIVRNGNDAPSMFADKSDNLDAPIRNRCDSCLIKDLDATGSPTEINQELRHLGKIYRLCGSCK